MYLVGIVLKPRGLSGELKVEPVSPYPDRFKQLEKVYIKNEDNYQAYPIINVRISGRFVFLKIRDINNRESAELLRDKELFIKKEHLIALQEDEYYIHDLIDCTVFDEQDNIIGILKQVISNSASDIYLVKSESGKEILIPAVKDFIKKIDVRHKRIKIHMIEGLLD